LTPVFGSIVVGTDGSETASEAVRQAVELAKRCGARLHLVSAYKPLDRPRVAAGAGAEAAGWAINPEAKVDAILASAAGTSRSGGLAIELHAVKGDPADALIQVAEKENADLIVVGNKGMTGSRRFLLGSVPDKVSHHAPCSVMIVHTA
jgi:nucleotide-binding universal stress UspA family protein